MVQFLDSVTVPVLPLMLAADGSLADSSGWWAVLHAVLGGVVLLLLQWIYSDLIPQIAYRFRRDEPTLPIKWRTLFVEDGIEYHETVELRQRGRRITGQIALAKNGDGQVLVYRLNGVFRHLILSAVYCSTDPSSYEQGSFTLRYTSNDGKQRLEGHYIFQSSRNSLEASPYAWTPSN